MNRQHSTKITVKFIRCGSLLDLNCIYVHRNIGVFIRVSMYEFAFVRACVCICVPYFDACLRVAVCALLECVCVHTLFSPLTTPFALCVCLHVYIFFRRCFFFLLSTSLVLMLLFIFLTVFVFLHLHSISSMYVCIFKLKIKHRIYRELICTQTKRYVAFTAPRYFSEPDRIESNPVSCSLLICGFPDSRLHTTTHTYAI